MIDIPDWLSWRFNTPEIDINDHEKWLIGVDWLMSAPHLHPNEDRSKGYQAIKEWTFGLCTTIVHLLLLQKAWTTRPRADENMLVWPARDWIENREQIAQAIVARTINILNGEFVTQQIDKVNNHREQPPPSIKPSSTTRSMAKAVLAMASTPADGTRKRSRAPSVTGSNSGRNVAERPPKKQKLTQKMNKAR